MIEIAVMSLAVLVILLSIGVPLPYCFGGGLMFMYFVGDVTMKGNMLWGFGQLTNPVLLCIPLFVFAGAIMSESGIAKSLLSFVNIFVGRIRGGLGAVSIFTCTLIGAISGSGLTGVAAVGPLLIPEMVRKGYPRGYATALVVNSSVLGLLIPPSVTMIIYGWVTDTSILASFLATVGPGILIALQLTVANFIMSRKFPLILDEVKSRPEFFRESLRTSGNAMPAILMPIIILGGIYAGVMTPTEAAAVAVLYSIPVGVLFYKGLTLKNFFSSAESSATAVGSIMIMIIFSLMLSQVFVMEDIPQTIVKAIFSVTENRVVLLILINVLLFLVGMVVNDITAIILIAPLLLPLMTALGISPVHFAAIIGVNTAMGGVTPPYASILYLGMRIGNASFTEVVPYAMTFLLCSYVPTCFLVSFWPELSLYIPSLLGY